MYIKGALASIVLALGLISSPAYSYVLGGTDVGDLDTFVSAKVGMSSGESTEETWASQEASSFEGTDISLVFSGKSDPAGFNYVDGDPGIAGIVAFQLSTEPSYFLVKDARTHVLFKNVASIDWGVFNLFDYFEGKEGLTLSHLTEFSGGDGDVPVSEPGTALLLAIGIFGLVANRKRMKKSV